jgi:hypothetical protein
MASVQFNKEDCVVVVVVIAFVGKGVGNRHLTNLPHILVCFFSLLFSTTKPLSKDF